MDENGGLLFSRPKSSGAAYMYRVAAPSCLLMVGLLIGFMITSRDLWRAFQASGGRATGPAEGGEMGGKGERELELAGVQGGRSQGDMGGAGETGGAAAARGAAAAAAAAAQLRFGKEHRFVLGWVCLMIIIWGLVQVSLVQFEIKLAFRFVSLSLPAYCNAAALASMAIDVGLHVSKCVSL